MSLEILALGLKICIYNIDWRFESLVLYYSCVVAYQKTVLCDNLTILYLVEFSSMVNNK